MTETVQGQLILGLILWALLSLGTATIGLYSRPREFWHSFWFMSGIWGLVDGLIAWFAMLGTQQAPAQILPFLRFNTGLDVLYIVAGIFLLTRPRVLLRGFGLAVIVQGVFLLAFDGYFWWKCASLTS